MSHLISLVAVSAFLLAYSWQQAAIAAKATEREPNVNGHAFYAEPSPPDCTLCVKTNPLLVVDTNGTASGVMRVCNRGKDPITLRLTVSDFFAVGPGGRYPLSSSSALAPATDAAKGIPEGKTPLGINDCADIKIDVSKLWHGGRLSAQLSNDAEKLVDLKAIRFQVPFNLKVDGSTPEKVDVSFTRGKPTQIRLRNEDSMPYRFRWQLEVGDKVKNGEQWADPNRLVTLPVTLDPESFSFFESGFLRSAAKSGLLVLDYEPDPSFRGLPLPQKRYPVAARLNYWDEDNQRIFNYFWILVIVILGITISLLVNYALPTQRKRVAIKQKLADLEGRLAGLGNVVGSRTLSVLRVEKKRLRDELRLLWPVFPSTEAELSKLEERVDWLAKRIELTVIAGEHLAAIEAEGDLSQPEEDLVRSHCQVVFRLVEKPARVQKEIDSAELRLQLAAQLRDSVTQAPPKEMYEALKNAATKVKGVLKNVTNPREDSPWEPFFELAQMLQKDIDEFLGKTSSAEYQPERRDYVRYAGAVNKAERLVEFVHLVEVSPNDTICAKRKSRGKDLLNALEPGPDESLQRAQDIVREVEQNIGKQDIVGEIEKGSISIEVDPPTPLPYQLVTFRVHFNRHGLDAAAAQREIECNWKIDDQELGEGWSIVHYFERDRPSRIERIWCWAKTFVAKPILRQSGTGDQSTAKVGPKGIEVTAILRDLTQDKELSRIHSKPFKLEETKTYGKSMIWLALGTLLVTVLVVGIGLLAGAQEKLQSLDWISGLVAVLLLGFGADVLKKMLTRP